MKLVPAPVPVVLEKLCRAVAAIFDGNGHVPEVQMGVFDFEYSVFAHAVRVKGMIGKV
jgi:hypothetical protein